MFFFSSRRRHTRWPRDWSSDVCSSDLWGYIYFPLGPNATEYNALKTSGGGYVIPAGVEDPEIVYQIWEDLQIWRSEEHTSELQSRGQLVCRLLLEKKKRKTTYSHRSTN